MPSPHDPDHTRGASVLLPDAAEETGRPMPTKKELKVNDSLASARFWLGLVVFVFGLAVLATALIFFSDWPGALAVEVIGAGLALLAICALVISRLWRQGRSQPKEGLIPADLPDHPSLPAPTAAPPQPDAHPAPVLSTEPTTIATPAVDEPIQTEANAATQAAEERAEPAIPQAGLAESSPAAGDTAAPSSKRTTRPRKTAAQNGQRSAGAAQARPTPPAGTEAGAARGVPARSPSNGTNPRLPALTNLPTGLPTSVDRNLIDPDAHDLGELLGDIAEQTVLVMLTRGQRGAQRRERMAARIDLFRNEMALDPDYAPVANFLEAITGLLRAGTIVPASRPLVDPFDGLYDYVLTLIRRKSGTQHD